MKLKGKFLAAVISLALIFSSVHFNVQAENTATDPQVDTTDYVLANDLTMSKEIVQYGDVKDRIYQVTLTVKGEIQTVVDPTPATIFLLIDLSASNAGIGNMPMWPYYMRAVWNMCNELTVQNPDRAFDVYLIPYSYKGALLVEEYSFSSQDKTKLGNPDRLYIDKSDNDKPVFAGEGAQMFHYYNTDMWDSSTVDGQSLLGGLSRLSYMTLPNNYLDENKGGMDFVSTRLSNMSYHSNVTTPGYVNGGELLHGVDVSAALAKMNEIIESKNISNAQAVMLSDTLPSAENGASGNVNDGGQLAVYLQNAYDAYEISRKDYNVIFHMFGLGAFSSEQEQSKDLWKEFTESIGNNKIRKNKSWKYEGLVYTPNEWEDYPSNIPEEDKDKYQNTVTFKWDHELGKSTDDASYAQRVAMRGDLNNSLKTIASNISSNLIEVTTFGNFVYVQNTIPNCFHILNTGEYKPSVSTSVDGITYTPNPDVIERTSIFPADKVGNVENHFPPADVRWEKEAGIRWKLRELSTTNGTYKFTFYIQANRDYFGGEEIFADSDSAVYYMSYDQWVALGKPETDAGEESKKWKRGNFTREGFIYRVAPDENGVYHFVLDENGNKVLNPTKEEKTDDDKKWCNIQTYVPWQQPTQNGEVTIFYGDSADIVRSSSYQEDPFVNTVRSNTDTSPEVNYYFQPDTKVYDQTANGIYDENAVDEEHATWKNKAGEELLFNYKNQATNGLSP